MLSELLESVAILCAWWVNEKLTLKISFYDTSCSNDSFSLAGFHKFSTYSRVFLNYVEKWSGFKIKQFTTLQIH